MNRAPRARRPSTELDDIGRVARKLDIIAAQAVTMERKAAMATVLVLHILRDLYGVEGAPRVDNQVLIEKAARILVEWVLSLGVADLEKDVTNG